MDWHKRYLQQACWTRDLRRYVWERAGLSRAGRILEVGCGTGAILQELAPPSEAGPRHRAAVHGLDVSFPALARARVHAPGALLARADAHTLPYPSRSFDITFCHFLLLWVKDPVVVVREMSRVTRRGGHVIAFAEPAYHARPALPANLARLGDLQEEALVQQGADPNLGARLAQVFGEAGLHISEAGPLGQWQLSAIDDDTLAAEWEVLREDTKGLATPADIDAWMNASNDERRLSGPLLHVPTFFAWAQV